MAGHSHWSKVKRTKGVLDQRRGSLFSKLSREITMAAKLGGGDPSFNPRLRSAVETARSESVPVENIERAIKKGTGELAGESYEEITYEGYGPGGVAMFIEATTDNKNRSAAEIRSIFAKNNGNMAGAGSVAWMFHRKGSFLIDSSKATEDRLLEITLDAGAEDVKTLDSQIEIVCSPAQYDSIRAALDKAGIPIEKSALAYIPENLTAVTDDETAAQVLKLYEALEDHDDVQHVYATFDIAPEILTRLETHK